MLGSVRKPARGDLREGKLAEEDIERTATLNSVSYNKSDF